LTREILIDEVRRDTPTIAGPPPHALDMDLMRAMHLQPLFREPALREIEPLVTAPLGAGDYAMQHPAAL